MHTRHTRTSSQGFSFCHGSNWLLCLCLLLLLLLYGLVMQELCPWVCLPALDHSPGPLHPHFPFLPLFLGGRETTAGFACFVHTSRPRRKGSAPLPCKNPKHPTDPKHQPQPTHTAQRELHFGAHKKRCVCLVLVVANYSSTCLHSCKLAEQLLEP